MGIHTAWLVKFIEEGLQGGWSAQQLLEWCVGIGLPPVGRADAAYYSLWLGIENAPNPEQSKAAFAEKIADVWPSFVSEISSNSDRSDWLKEIDT